VAHASTQNALEDHVRRERHREMQNAIAKNSAAGYECDMRVVMEKIKDQKSKDQGDRRQAMGDGDDDCTPLPTPHP
jgi:hypothetical protein